MQEENQGEKLANLGVRVNGLSKRKWWTCTLAPPGNTVERLCASVMSRFDARGGDAACLLYDCIA